MVITGANLDGATAVSFGAAAAASFTVDNATQITATTPAGSGTVDVTVTTAGGTSAAQPFTYVAAPAITSLAPTSGPEAGGTSVVITGANLDGATAVSFGAAAAASFTVDNATQITATSPAGSGTVDVTVTTPGGTSATGPDVEYTYLPPSTNADLADLTVSGTPLMPAFDPDTLTYNASVAHTLDSVTVTPTTADAGATVTVDGVLVDSGTASAPIALTVGDNTITVQVTAADGITQKSYQVTLDRAPLQHVAAPPGSPGAGLEMDIDNVSPTCTLTDVDFSAITTATTSPPGGYIYPYGMLGFTARQCGVGSTLTVTLTFPSPLPDDAVLMKYDEAATPPWRLITPTIIGNQAIYTVIDGGLNDADMLQNGEFVDPIAPALPAGGGAIPIPVLDRWGLLLLALLAALFGMHAMRRAGT